MNTLHVKKGDTVTIRSGNDKGKSGKVTAVFPKTNMVVVEGMSSGVSADGVEWRADVTHAGRWTDVFEIRDFEIQRCFIYLDPDYAGADTDRYHWLARPAAITA